MPHPFDPQKPLLRNYRLVRPQIGDGWLLQFRGSGLISRAIQYGTGGVHSHSAMAARLPSGKVEVLELRELVGGRASDLSEQVRRYPGRIDVFQPNAGERWPEWSGRRAVRAMRRLASRRYGYRGVARLALQKIPVLWRLWPLDMSDETSRGAPFCSHAVAAACRAGGVDPVPRKPDHRVTPNDLTWSLFFAYRFTLSLEDPYEFRCASRPRLSP